MHHVRLYDIQEDPLGYDVIYTTDNGGPIRMSIPRSGVLEDPDREVTRNQVEDVARKVEEILRDNLS